MSEFRAGVRGTRRAVAAVAAAGRSGARSVSPWDAPGPGRPEGREGGGGLPSPPPQTRGPGTPHGYRLPQVSRQAPGSPLSLAGRRFLGAGGDAARGDTPGTPLSHPEGGGYTPACVTPGVRR